MNESAFNWRGAGDGPPPCAVPGNEWWRVPVAPPSDFVPTERVSVVVPGASPDALASVLSDLERQTYASNLIEVVAVDNGSLRSRDIPNSPIQVRVEQAATDEPGRGVLLDRGARAARHPILVLVPTDLPLGPELLADHARWHHAVADALTVSLSARPEALRQSKELTRQSILGAGSLFERAGFRNRGRTRRSTASQDRMSRNDEIWWSDDVFLALSRGSFAIRTAFYERIGRVGKLPDWDEGWALEFAWRAYALGALMIPASDRSPARRGGGDVVRDRRKGMSGARREGLANAIPHRNCRDRSPTRYFPVPRHVVTLEPGWARIHEIVNAIALLLNDPVGDVLVRVETELDAHPDPVRWLEEFYQADPRVQVAPLRSALDEFPVSPIHVTLRAHLVGRRTLSRLLASLVGHVEFRRVKDEALLATVSHSWALHRARRTGRPLSDFGTVSVLGGRGDIRERIEGRARKGLSNGTRETGEMGMTEALRKILARARAVRGPRSGLRFVLWLGRGIAHRVRRPVARRWRALAPEPVPANRVSRGPGRTLRRAPSGGAASRQGNAATNARIIDRNHGLETPTSSTLLRTVQSSSALGAVIRVRGLRAAAVFAASKHVDSGFGDGAHVDVILADTPALALDTSAPVVTPQTTAPAIWVPAFDPLHYNPVGWPRSTYGSAVALGPPRHLPGDATDVVQVSLTDRQTLRYAHHLEDTAVFHADSVSRAGVLVRIAATGLPVHLADAAPELAPLLGSELFDLMTEAPVRGADAIARERLSIRMRRAALRDHSLESRARQVCEAAHMFAPPAPLKVSVLLPTRRPAFLHWAIANVARQNYPRLELVLALHGDGFAAELLESALGDFGARTQVVRVGCEHPLGTVLNLATSVARGELVTTMDDDDLYGADHVWDLVLARGYTGATLVGKQLEASYLCAEDITLRCPSGQSERDGPVNGGALLIGREDLLRLGGWARVPMAEDADLIRRLKQSGETVYRTHGAGRVYVRHDQVHAFEDGENWVRARASESLPGWVPSIADITGPLPRHPARRVVQ